MACLHPITVWRKVGGYNPLTHKVGITFDFSKGHPSSAFQLPCGQCIACRLKKSRDWMIRLVHELRDHAEACFITLTYSPEDLPPGNTLVKRHLQLFMKRLRKALEPIKVRYYAVGEYGSQFGRAHYHIILFGHGFPDKYFWKMASSGYPLYRSPSLEKLWTYGHSNLGQVTMDSAGYVARYSVPKQTGKSAAAYYGDREPEFALMSRRPGIAHEWWSEFHHDIYSGDKLVLRGGIQVRPPRYYDLLFAATHENEFRRILSRRKSFARVRALALDSTGCRSTQLEELYNLRQSRYTAKYHKL